MIPGSTLNDTRAEKSNRHWRLVSLWKALMVLRQGWWTGSDPWNGCCHFFILDQWILSSSHTVSEWYIFLRDKGHYIMNEKGKLSSVSKENEIGNVSITCVGGLLVSLQFWPFLTGRTFLLLFTIVRILYYFITIKRIRYCIWSSSSSLGATALREPWVQFVYLFVIYLHTKFHIVRPNQ
jgi:hypothetical protein